MAALMGATHVLSSVPPVGDFDQDPVLADAACAGALVAAAAMGSSGRFPAQADDTPSPSSSFPPSSSPDFSLPSSSSMLSPAPPSPLPATSPGQDLPTLSPRLQWVGYLSSTGVYGDRGGGWVDEDTAPCPASPKGVARYVAEEAWRDMCELHGVPVVVFRLGGIYGPGRSMLDTVAARARASAGPRTHPASGAESRSQRARGSRKFTSRCHVGDVVAVLCASIARTAEIAVAEEVVEAAAAVGEAAAVLSSAPPPSFSSAPATSRVYNVVDDEPAPRADAAAFARILLQLPLDDADADAGVDASGTGGNGVESARGEKRVRNDRIKGELGVRLRYPTYREGLAAIADGDRTPFF